MQLFESEIYNNVPPAREDKSDEALPPHPNKCIRLPPIRTSPYGKSRGTVGWLAIIPQRWNLRSLSCRSIDFLYICVSTSMRPTMKLLIPQ